MRINTSSWHYRYVHWWMTHEPGTLRHPIKRDSYNHDLMPKSLCTYFWTLVFFLTLLPFAAVVIGVLVYVVAAVWLLLRLIRTAFKATVRELRWGPKSPPAKSEPSVPVEFLKATKRKVCPIITYEGDEVTQ